MLRACPLEVCSGHVHARGRERTARRSVHAGAAGVAEEVQEPRAVGHLAEHVTGRTVIEEQTGVDVVREVDLEEQAVFAHDAACAGSSEAVVLLGSPLPASLLHEHVFRSHAED